MHRFHTLFPPTLLPQLLDVDTTHVPLCGLVGVATSAQTWPTSKTGSIKPTQRAVPHIGSETACWYPDTASFTYAH